MTNTQIIERANKLSNQMGVKNFDNGISRVIILDGENHQELVDLTFTVSQETSLDSDSVYEFTSEALDLIGGAQEDDDLQELSTNIEADVYTSDLTDFLARGNSNVYYLNEAIKDGVEDGGDALAIAQELAKTDVFNIVLNHLQQA